MTAVRRTLPRLWRAPLVLAILTAVGLVSALLGDGAWDALSWLALAGPVATVVWYTARRRAIDSSNARR